MRKTNLERCATKHGITYLRGRPRAQDVSLRHFGTGKLTRCYVLERIIGWALRFQVCNLLRSISRPRIFNLTKTNFFRKTKGPILALLVGGDAEPQTAAEGRRTDDSQMRKTRKSS
jgi:hypothetical protein